MTGSVRPRPVRRWGTAGRPAGGLPCGPGPGRAAGGTGRAVRSGTAVRVRLRAGRPAGRVRRAGRRSLDPRVGQRARPAAGGARVGEAGVGRAGRRGGWGRVSGATGPGPATGVAGRRGRGLGRTGAGGVDGWGRVSGATGPGPAAGGSARRGRGLGRTAGPAGVVAAGRPVFGRVAGSATGPASGPAAGRRGRGLGRGAGAPAWSEAGGRASGWVAPGPAVVGGSDRRGRGLGRTAGGDRRDRGRVVGDDGRGRGVAQGRRALGVEAGAPEHRFRDLPGRVAPPARVVGRPLALHQERIGVQHHPVAQLGAVVHEGVHAERAAVADQHRVGLEAGVLQRVALDHRAALSVTASPMVTSVFSGITAPSSNSRRPTRTPDSRHSIPLTGVPSNTGRKLIRLSFHIRSCRQ